MNAGQSKFRSTPRPWRGPRNPVSRMQLGHTWETAVARHAQREGLGPHQRFRLIACGQSLFKPTTSQEVAVVILKVLHQLLRLHLEARGSALSRFPWTAARAKRRVWPFLHAPSGAASIQVTRGCALVHRLRLAWNSQRGSWL